MFWDSKSTADLCFNECSIIHAGNPENTQRWQIELFFRQSKKKLGLDKYQLRSQKGIQRYWLMMSFVHYMCCTCKGTYCSFDEGYAYMQQELKAEHLKHLFQVIKSGATFEDVLEIAG